MVILNFEDGDVDNSVLSYYQENLHVLPNFSYDFLLKGLLSQEEISNLIENDRESLLRIIQENDAAVSNVSPGIILLESLKFAVNREGIRVKNVAEIGEGRVTDYLIYDENFIYITSEKLWECGTIRGLSATVFSLQKWQRIAHSIERGRSYFPEERRAFSSRDLQNYNKRNSH